MLLLFLLLVLAAPRLLAVADLVYSCTSQCPFSTLESAMMEDEGNQYNLWTTFHHPRGAFPQYLAVNYIVNNSFSNDTNRVTYLWTSNSIYFVIPPQVFGFLSLFLGVLDHDHIGSVNLTIPEECSCFNDFYEKERDNARYNYLEVLTEKVCWVFKSCGYFYLFCTCLQSYYSAVHPNSRTCTF